MEAEGNFLTLPLEKSNEHYLKSPLNMADTICTTGV